MNKLIDLSISKRAARTLTSVGRVAAVLLAVILTMTAQTAWAQGTVRKLTLGEGITAEGEGITLQSDGSYNVPVGTVVMLDNTKSGYFCGGYELSAGELSNGNTFTMPDQDVNVTADFILNSEITTVNNWAELKAAINDGAVIKLEGDDVYKADGTSISIDAGTVTIYGNGHTIDAQTNGNSIDLIPIDELHVARLFKIENGATLTLKNLILKRAYSDKDGGAIYNDGGTLNVANCTFTNNTATTEKGGAIYNKEGTLRIVSSIFDKNAKYDRAIYNYGDEDHPFRLTIINCTMIEDKVCVNYEDKERRLDDKRDIDLLTTEVNAYIQEIIYEGNPVLISLSGIDTDFTGSVSVNMTNTIYNTMVDVANGEGRETMDMDINRYTARFKNFISLTEDAFERDDTRPYLEINFKVVTTNSFSALEDMISKALDNATNTVTLSQDYVYDSKTDNAYIRISDKTLTFYGNGHSISGNTNNGDALFLIEDDSNVRMERITLENGHGQSRSHLGQQIRMGGAIFVSRSNLTLINCTLQNNKAEGGSGGAIYSDFSTLNIIRCVFTNNKAENGKNLYVQGGNGVYIYQSDIDDDEKDIYIEPDWDNEDKLAKISIINATSGNCGATGNEANVHWALADADSNGILETLTISGTGAMADFNNYNDQPWKLCRGAITTVTIASGVTSIGKDAFKDCTDVTNVYCYADPESLTWNENGCDDFNYDDSNPYTKTKCHVFDESAWTTKFGSTVNVTFVGGLGSSTCPVVLTEADGVDLLTSLAAQKNSRTDIPDNLNVTFSRTFDAGTYGSGKASTVCLPYAVTPDASVGTFYTFGGVSESGGVYTVTMNEMADATTTAGTPYLFKPAVSSGSSTVPFNGNIPIATTYEEGKKPDTNGWEFRGTFEKLTWPSGQTQLYGFAAADYKENGTTIDADEVGSFRRYDWGYCDAFRCYLWAPDPSTARGATRSGNALPESMRVILVATDGTTTDIGTMDTKTGDVSFDGDAWYGLDGRRLSGKPTKSGVYINNGKKVLVP